MDPLKTREDEDRKKRRSRIGIILIVIGLLGMLLGALSTGSHQQTQTPTTSVTEGK